MVQTPCMILTMGNVHAELGQLSCTFEREALKSYYKDIIFQSKWAGGNTHSKVIDLIF